MGFKMLMRWEKYEKSTSTQIPQDCDQNLENLTVKQEAEQHETEERARHLKIYIYMLCKVDRNILTF